MNEMTNQDGQNKDFSMQEIRNLQGQMLTGMNNLLEMVGDLSKSVADTRSEVTTVKKSVTDMETRFEASISDVKKDITDLKENSEITPAQRKNIRKAVHRRVYKLLNIPIKRDDRSMADKVKIDKYSGLFHKRCYSEVRREGHLGDPYEMTLKKNYDQAIQDIEAWYPSNGVDGLKAEADENALARKIAKEQGYLDQAEREVTEHGDK